MLEKKVHKKRPNYSERRKTILQILIFPYTKQMYDHNFIFPQSVGYGCYSHEPDTLKIVLKKLRCEERIGFSLESRKNVILSG